MSRYGETMMMLFRARLEAEGVVRKWNADLHNS
jgi:hypothetical protein